MTHKEPCTADAGPYVQPAFLDTLALAATSPAADKVTSAQQLSSVPEEHPAFSGRRSLMSCGVAKRAPAFLD